MPLTLNKHLSNTATVTFAYEGESVTVAYYPNSFTRKALQELDKGVDAFTEILPTLIKSWNVYEDDAETIMFPVERIEELGFPFCVALMQAITSDIRPEQKALQEKTTSSFS